MNELARTKTGGVIEADGRHLPAVAYDGPADRHPAAVYLASLAPGSRPAMRRALDVIAKIALSDDDATLWDLPWHKLRFQHTQAIRSALEARYAFTTVNKMLSALRQTLKMAWRLDLIPAETYRRAADVENVGGEREPAGRSFGYDELVAMLDSCDQEPLGVRDAAMISLLYACGLRRAELVDLDLADYDPETHRLLIRGKGNKEREMPAGNAAPALADWLTVRGREPGPLFWGLGNRNRRGRLTTQAVYCVLKKRAKAAGIEELSPHDFRRTFVGDLLDAGADMATVQKMAGHADPATTSRYDRRGYKAKEEAAALLRVPYRRRGLHGRE